jgi:hypothetical protein
MRKGWVYRLLRLTTYLTARLRRSRPNLVVMGRGKWVLIIVVAEVEEQRC